MTLYLKHPQNEIDKAVRFIRKTFDAQAVRKAVIAVSGGIDSGLSLTLLTTALGAENVHALQLPYHRQSCADASVLCTWNHLPKSNITRVNIGPVTDSVIRNLHIPVQDRTRRGNIMARIRMLITYDHAKEKRSMVCGTENKSEKYLGYFTRFGDEASDIEPIQQWYKTQVRQLSSFLHMPRHIIDKPPSAELWENQTDEQELGFTYEQADPIIDAYLCRETGKGTIKVEGLSQATVDAVIQRIESQKFKLEVPYGMKNK